MANRTPQMKNTSPSNPEGGNVSPPHGGKKRLEVYLDENFLAPWVKSDYRQDMIGLVAVASDIKLVSYVKVLFLSLIKRNF